ncbi:protein PF14 0175-like, partial [Aphis craccivora]
MRELPMASRQSVSSILKPPKVRAPLKEIETVDQDADENTATFSKRKVSFSGMNKIKMYNTGATSLTVHQAPMFDEQISILSDSSNAEKPKISGKFEKSDAQISIESTNCTNFEDNGRIIIEYESPNDNMEMTEALSGKILSDTIYTIDNNGSEHISYNSDYSENNMEFTEAIKVGQILTGDNSCDLSSTKMSETLVDESDEESVSQFDLLPSTPLSNVPIQNTLNISSSSSCMDFTCANTKSNLSCNTQSSNMELTCMTKSLKSFWSNDNYKSMSMELTQLPDRQTIEDNCELIYEYSEHSISMGSNTSCEIQEKSSCELDIVQTEKSEKNNSNYQTIDCVLDNSNNGEENMIEELSLSMVSMDIDPTLEGNAFDISYVNVDNPLKVENEQKLSTIPTTATVENSCNLKQSVLDNYSNIIDICNQNNESGLSILPTGSSFVVNMSPENNINKYVEEEKLLQQTLHDHTSVLDKNQYLENKSIIVENNLQKKYSRKTMIHTCPLIDQENSHENEDTSGTVKNNQQKHYSRKSKSIVPTTVFNDDISDDASVVVEENQQEEYSRKSIASTIDFNDDISDTSVLVEENQQEKYSRKSIAPTTVFNDDMSDTSVVVEENQQENYTRKSIAPTTVFNDDISDTSVVVEENQQGDNGTLDTSVPLEENQQKKYSRKSIAPTTVFNDDISDTSVVVEENQQGDNGSLDTSVSLEENQQENYTRKSIAPTTVFNNDISDTSVALKENQQEDNGTLDMSVALEENQQENYT